MMANNCCDGKSECLQILPKREFATPCTHSVSFQILPLPPTWLSREAEASSGRLSLGAQSASRAMCLLITNVQPIQLRPAFRPIPSLDSQQKSSVRHSSP